MSSPFGIRVQSQGNSNSGISQSATIVDASTDGGNISGADDDDLEYRIFLKGLQYLDGGVDEQGQEEDDTEDEEEDYSPAKRGLHSDGDFGDSEGDDDDDEEEDDESDDNDVEEDARIGKLELKELLKGTLQAVAGEAPNDPEVMHEGESLSQASGNSSTADITPERYGKRSPSRKKTTTASTTLNSPKRGGLSTTHNNKMSTSAILSKIFSGERSCDLSDMLLYGMPLSALRRLLARQMSMSAQLIVQILLQSSYRDEQTSSECSHRLFELGNQRQRAVKQAALIGIVGQTFQLAEHGKFSGGNDDGQQRLTRGSVLQSNQRGRSVLDVPIYADIPSLLGRIDQASSEVAASSSLLSLSDSDNGSQESNNQRARLLTELAKQSESVLNQSNMRVWRCLIPSAQFPMSENALRSVDPNTLVGRHQFTPAEDNLLLLAVVKLGEGQWQRVCDEYLVSKTPDQVQFRFNQMTSGEFSKSSSTSRTTTNERKFMEYKRLVDDFKTRDQSWQHWEDLALLRGFAIYGERWPLIQMYHVPHRERLEIIARWDFLQVGNDKYSRNKHDNKGKGKRKGRGSEKYSKEFNNSATEDIMPFLCELLEGKLNTFKDVYLEKRPASTTSGLQERVGSINQTKDNVMEDGVDTNLYHINEEGEEGDDVDDDTSHQLHNPTTGPPVLGHQALKVKSILNQQVQSSRVSPLTTIQSTNQMGPPVGIPMRVASKSVIHRPYTRVRPPLSRVSSTSASNLNETGSSSVSNASDMLLSQLQEQAMLLQRQQEAINRSMQEIQTEQAELKRQRHELEEMTKQQDSGKTVVTQNKSYTRKNAKKRRIAPEAMERSMAEDQASAAPRAFADARNIQRLPSTTDNDDLSYSSGGSNSTSFNDGLASIGQGNLLTFKRRGMIPEHASSSNVADLPSQIHTEDQEDIDQLEKNKREAGRHRSNESYQSQKQPVQKGQGAFFSQVMAQSARK
jgi:hypothetical protein